MDGLSDFDSDSDDEKNLVITLALMEYDRLYLNKQPCRTSTLTGHEWVQEIIRGNPTRIYESLRMDKQTFSLLCSKLIEIGRLKSTKNVIVEEQVAMFLMTICHIDLTRDNAERFQHSTWTVSKYFHKVLKAVNRLAKRVITPPSMDTTPPEIEHNSKYYPYFKVIFIKVDMSIILYFHISKINLCSIFT